MMATSQPCETAPSRFIAITCASRKKLEVLVDLRKSLKNLTEVFIF
jgi:hypothetical protein